MDVRYSPDTRQWAEGLKLLEQASTKLADVVGPRESKLLQAEWSRTQDRDGQGLFRLTIRDSADEVSTDFTRDDLENTLHMRFRLPRLWGDLLKLRNDRHHEILNALLAKGVEEN